MGLPWMRIDTNLPQHDKIITLADYGDRGLAAGFVYICSLAYAGAYSTDGIITKSTLRFIHGKVSHAKLLVETRLWELDERGYRIRNYGNKQVVGAVQQVISDQLSAAGKRGAAARWSTRSGKTKTWTEPEANGPPMMAPPEARPDAHRNATYGTERNEDGPRLRSLGSSTERARVESLKSQRELIRNRRSDNPA